MTQRAALHKILLSMEDVDKLKATPGFEHFDEFEITQGRGGWFVYGFREDEAKITGWDCTSWGPFAELGAIGLAHQLAMVYDATFEHP